MSSTYRHARLMIWAILGAMAAPTVAQEQDLVDRRQQARRFVLATPQRMYDHYCAHCHGEEATGGGRLWATDLAPGPADLTATSLEEAPLRQFIDQGSAAAGRSNLCPPWGRTISSADISRLAHYILSLSGSRTDSSASIPPPPHPSRFPWLLVAVLLGELCLLWRLLRIGKESANALSQDPPLRG